ncbi:hypothetical protein B0T20DRAFT_474400 [Sordaria brevicollis]|uniref:Uncharacterized protein n=1 Tax=Sordaria brevicollis TaxID=83679 RepID=A0AAE0PMI7_SORBR|nr:hypothetical protein B0T20DRAFT_474400 [Sordaria brevicollis]
MCQGRIISLFCPSSLSHDPRCPTYRFISPTSGLVPAWSYYFDFQTATCCGRHSPRVDCGDCPYNTYGLRNDGQTSVYIHQGESMCPVCVRRCERERFENGEEMEGWAVRELQRGRGRRERERLEEMEREEGRLVREMERLRIEGSPGAVGEVEVLRRVFGGMRF